MPGPQISKMGDASEYWFEEGCFIIESWNSDKDPDVSIVRARVLPGEVTAFHSLDGTVERYVILQGHGEVELGDGPPKTVRPGDVVFIPAGCRQRIRNRSDEDLVFLAICSPRFQSDCYRDESS
jgi:mannose-6-phosphate isomerase-like protein (cupin superfamily)